MTKNLERRDQRYVMLSFHHQCTSVFAVWNEINRIREGYKLSLATHLKPQNLKTILNQWYKKPIYLSKWMHPRAWKGYKTLPCRGCNHFLLILIATPLEFSSLLLELYFWFEPKSWTSKFDRIFFVTLLLRKTGFRFRK